MGGREGSPEVSSRGCEMKWISTACAVFSSHIRLLGCGSEELGLNGLEFCHQVEWKERGAREL